MEEEEEKEKEDVEEENDYMQAIKLYTFRQSS